MNTDDLIQKWLSNDLSEAEKIAFENLDDYQSFVDIIDNAKHFSADQFSEMKSFEDFKTHYDSQKTTVKSINWTHTFIRIASIIVVAFGIYFTFFFNNLTEFKTIASQKTTIELPDASQVMLNADSEIAFNSRDWDSKRLVNLEGEAYFKVAKGKTFDVVTDDGIVTVVGTEFNVKQRDNYFEVQCFEGIVKVVSNSNSKTLLAGDTFLMLNNNFTEGSIDAIAPFWTTNISRFEALPFSEVVSELERQFNIKVDINDIHENRLFTGGFSHSNLENALIAITQPMNLTYTMNASNNVVIHDEKK